MFPGRLSIAFLAVALLAGCVTNKTTKVLPGEGVELTADEVIKLYAGKTHTNEKGALSSYDQDGTFYALSEGNDFYGLGTWSVEENTICYEATWYGPDWETVSPAYCVSFLTTGNTIWWTWEDYFIPFNCRECLASEFSNGLAAKKPALELRRQFQSD